jgi:hypothetical protein
MELDVTLLTSRILKVALTFLEICAPVPKGMLIVSTAALIINFKAEL